MKRTILAVTILLLVISMVACGGAGSSQSTQTSNSNPAPQAGTANATVTMTDAPPAGVALVSFEVTVNSAVLQPGNVALISKSQRLELTKLQSNTAFLDAKDIPAGNYTSVDVNFSSPELTFRNNTGAAIGSCNVGQTCTIHPNISNATVSYNGAPFPITVAANQPFGLLVDFDLANSLQSSLDVIPAVTVKQITGSAGAPPSQEVDDILGKVTAVDQNAKTVTLQAGGSTGKSFVLTVDSNTVFAHFTDAGLTNAFSSVAMGQILKADVKLMSGGVMIAKVLELRNSSEEQEGELDGVIVSVDSATQFKMVASDVSPEIENTADVGNVVTVTINTGAKFTKDDLNLTIPQGVQFASSADLMVGQRVRVKPSAPPTGTPLTTSTADIRLLTSEITGRVSSVSGANFTLDSLSDLFTSQNPSVTSVQVDTSNLTVFDNATGVAALQVGDKVSVNGLLFNSAPPVVAARKVRKRN